MICFSVYMAYLYPSVANKNLIIGLFSIQWVLNVIWNPIFFHYHNAALGLISISALTLLVGYFLFHFYPLLKVKSLLILPYFIWLIIATSLNAFILFRN